MTTALAFLALLVMLPFTLYGFLMSIMFVRFVLDAKKSQKRLAQQKRTLAQMRAAQR